MSTVTDRPESASQVVKNSAVISAFNGLGFASALLIDIIIAARFGLGYETDAFFVAFTVPQLIATILLVAFRVVLVPIFSTVIVEDGESSLWRVSSNLANLSLLGVGVLAVAGSSGASLLIRILGAGLDESTQHLAISLCAVVFMMVIPLGAVEVFKATLNSLHSFAVPAATVLVRNIATLLVVVLGNQRLGIHSLALGYVIAAWLQLALLVRALLRKGFRYHFILQWREPRTAEALIQIRPPLAGAALGQGNILVERFLASFLPVGLVSALFYARRLLRAIDSMFLGSVSTALLPRLSAQFTRGSMSDFKRSLSLGLKLATSISVPVTVAIIAMNVPLVRLFLQRGAFDHEATGTTAQLLSLYMLGIPPMALFQMFLASCYATKDTRTPFHFRAVMLGLNVVFDFILFSVLDAAGLALALSLTRVIITTWAGWLLYRRIGSLSSDLLSFLIKTGLASAAMLSVLLGLRELFAESLGRSGLLGGALRVVAGTIVGAGIYVVLLLVLRVREAEQVTQIVKGRFMLGKAGKLRG